MYETTVECFFFKVQSFRHNAHYPHSMEYELCKSSTMQMLYYLFQYKLLSFSKEILYHYNACLTVLLVVRQKNTNKQTYLTLFLQSRWSFTNQDPDYIII